MFLPNIALTLALVSSAPVFATAIQPSTTSPTMGDICPVTGKTIPPGEGVKVTVKGRDYMVADAAAAQQLRMSPDQFLESDGTPKNSGTGSSDSPGSSNGSGSSDGSGSTDGTTPPTP